MGSKTKKNKIRKTNNGRTQIMYSVTIMFELNQEEIELIKLIRNLGYGTVSEIVVQDGKPKLVRQCYQNIKLGGGLVDKS